MNRYLVVLVTAVIVLAFSATAQADVRAVTVPITYDSPAPSLNPDPADDPANQNLLRSYTVSYDTDTGSVSISGVYNGNAIESERSSLPDTIRLGCGNPAITVNIFDEDKAGGPFASASISGFEGSVDAPITFNGQQESVTLSHNEFRDHDLRCVREGTYTDAGTTWYSLDYFRGYSPKEVADRDDTYVTVGPWYWSDKLSLRVRPTRFGIWGRSNAESGHFYNVRWTTWSRSVARGKGYGKALHGSLTKSGRFVFDSYRVSFTLSGKRLCGDWYEFTRITIKTRYGTRKMKVPHAC